MRKNENDFLRKAKKNKNDEFYTQLTDIEKELRHYKEHFKGKVIYCNCDDPRVSNFFKYMFRNLYWHSFFIDKYTKRAYFYALVIAIFR